MDGPEKLPKRIIIMCGHPGSGKTTTAHRIRQAMDDAIVVSRDYFRNPYIRDTFRWNGHLDEYSKVKAKKIDQIFYEDANQLLCTYNTVILDATFREWLAVQQASAFFEQKFSCCIFVIECVCSYQTLLQRLERQLKLGQKKFIKSPTDMLAYYIKSSETLDNQLLTKFNFIRFDTEKNLIVLQSLESNTGHFAKQLVAILEQPFNVSDFESFVTVPEQEKI